VTTIRFSELRSPQIEEAAEAGAMLVLPIGQTEQHGPHLPVCTDTFIVERVCEAAVRRVGDPSPAYVLDPIVYGYSQRVLTAWPGTFVLDQNLVVETLVAIGRSAAGMGFRKLVLASFHGNHDGVVRVAARLITDETGIGPGVVFPAAFAGDLIRERSRSGPAGSCHAGEMETSLMLHLAPHLVDMTAAPTGDRITNTCPYPSNQAFVSTWTRQKSRSGVYGEPAVASAEFGAALFDVIVEKTAEFLAYYHALDQPGCVFD